MAFQRGRIKLYAQNSVRATIFGKDFIILFINMCRRSKNKVADLYCILLSEIDILQPVLLGVIDAVPCHFKDYLCIFDTLSKAQVFMRSDWVYNVIWDVIVPVEKGKVWGII